MDNHNQAYTLTGKSGIRVYTYSNCIQGAIPFFTAIVYTLFDSVVKCACINARIRVSILAYKK